MRRLAVCVGILCALLIPLHAAQAGLFDLGFGVMGDSQSDEYQFESYGNGTSGTARNWVEQLVDYRSLNFGSLGTFSEPRRDAYEFNWARSGATSSTLLSSGQHTGLANQVSLGLVDVAVLMIGANDFLPFVGGPYSRIATADPTFDLTAFTNTLVGNIETALDAILLAGDVGVILVSVPDYGNTPVFRSLHSGLERERVALALRDVINPSVKQVALARNIPYVDLFGAGRDVFGSHDAPNSTVAIGGVDMNLLIASSDPHSAFVSDGVHPDTILQGTYANLVIAAFNIAYGDLLGAGESLATFSDLELLQHAGLGGEYVSETFSTSFDLNSYITFQAGAGPIPALSLQGVPVFLLLAVVSIHVIRRRRARTMSR